MIKLWDFMALHYVRSGKMIKKEKDFFEDKEEQENDLTISSKQIRRDIGPQTCITAAHSIMFSSHLSNIQDVHCK